MYVVFLLGLSLGDLWVDVNEYQGVKNARLRRNVGVWSLGLVLCFSFLGFEERVGFEIGGEKGREGMNGGRNERRKEGERSLVVLMREADMKGLQMLRERGEKEEE